MFVLSIRSDENLNYFIYDKPLPMGNRLNRKAVLRSLNVWTTLRATVHINFFKMSIEKVNVTFREGFPELSKNPKAVTIPLGSGIYSSTKLI